MRIELTAHLHADFADDPEYVSVVFALDEYALEGEAESLTDYEVIGSWGEGAVRRFWIEVPDDAVRALFFPADVPATITEGPA